jgi:hypothetical protein
MVRSPGRLPRLANGFRLEPGSLMFRADAVGCQERSRAGFDGRPGRIVDAPRAVAQNEAMFRLPSGGIFRREARWMLAMSILIPLVGFVLAIVCPWAARLLHER